MPRGGGAGCSAGVSSPGRRRDEEGTLGDAATCRGHLLSLLGGVVLLEGAGSPSACRAARAAGPEGFGLQGFDPSVVSVSQRRPRPGGDGVGEDRAMNYSSEWPGSSCRHPEPGTVALQLLGGGGGHLIHREEETAVERP